MEILIGSDVAVSENSYTLATGSIACIQISNFSTAQGVVVWEEGNLTCIRAFSRHYVGRRIQAFSDFASPKELYQTTASIS